MSFRMASRLALIPVVLWMAGCASGSGGALENEVRGSVSGERQYKVSCAACHGADARGSGPVAPLLNVAVPDLTRIAARRGGGFPELEIFQIIDGQADLQGHGPRHMPVWGYEFFGDDADDEVAHRRATEKVDRLVAYLRSIQRGD